MASANPLRRSREHSRVSLSGHTVCNRRDTTHQGRHKEIERDTQIEREETHPTRQRQTEIETDSNTLRGTAREVRKRDSKRDRKRDCKRDRKRDSKRESKRDRERDSKRDRKRDSKRDRKRDSKRDRKRQEMRDRERKKAISRQEISRPLLSLAPRSAARPLL